MTDKNWYSTTLLNFALSPKNRVFIHIYLDVFHFKVFKLYFLLQYVNVWLMNGIYNFKHTQKHATGCQDALMCLCSGASSSEHFKNFNLTETSTVTLQRFGHLSESCSAFLKYFKYVSWRLHEMLTAGSLRRKLHNRSLEYHINPKNIKGLSSQKTL